ncbi:fumarylacetoacetate hydrolase family protein [Cupriavidus sp. AU9028]|uniref:fumarylacetoacetate hydrolase family protein n=1 Tax=Cupriavidus sp. AU9028 TaxID=2871157 RepID=UPI001C97212A|nr:fumarylacetoacetate hydrolase family protein [Cupriavidus sp. AU9028]MBY4896544.1 fumarylacetoacetate hydrolase family protein [Cupriavidus sp. AU9028]
MTEFVFNRPAPTGVPIRGSSASFPVRRVYCVGRNYAAHAREMGADPDREPPFFFCKPSDAVSYVADGSEGAFPYPPGSNNVHYEVELVVAIGKGGRDIPVEQAASHVYGYAIGLDMTRRDLQNESKKTGRPWETGKAFDRSAPIGPIVRVEDIGHPERGAITLSVNGAEKQRGDLSDLIWSVPEMVAYLSRLFELQPGDLIYSGTPEGVGPVTRGDVMNCSIEGVGELVVKVV